MKKVRKGNVVYRIYDESKLGEYLADGYKVVEEKGKTKLETSLDDIDDIEETPKRKKN
jgi:hypothetical protein|nr:MAG TPA: hypothetical protein [Bacteriophage sp.]